MEKQSSLHLLSDGRTLTIRSLNSADAPVVVTYMKEMYTNSPYLVRYGDEWNVTISEEQTFLENAEKAASKLLLGGFIAESLVAISDYSPVGNSYKLAHRCEMGISVSQEEQGKGIGSLVLKTLIASAKRTGFEQMELEVAASNCGAIQLYLRNGFFEVGRIPHGIRYRDGSWEDLILMVVTL
ncbi:MAG: N-acetyltransferase family protein [Sphaerochaeta sp.]